MITTFESMQTRYQLTSDQIEQFAGDGFIKLSRVLDPAALHFYEPEITAKIARRRTPAWRVYEVPISYAGRTYEEGKKIGLKDAFNALYCIIRFWLRD